MHNAFLEGNKEKVVYSWRLGCFSTGGRVEVVNIPTEFCKIKPLEDFLVV